MVKFNIFMTLHANGEIIFFFNILFPYLPKLMPYSATPSKTGSVYVRHIELLQIYKIVINVIIKFIYKSELNYY